MERCRYELSFVGSNLVSVKDKYVSLSVIDLVPEDKRPCIESFTVRSPFAFAKTHVILDVVLYDNSYVNNHTKYLGRKFKLALYTGKGYEELFNECYQLYSDSVYLVDGDVLIHSAMRHLILSEYENLVLSYKEFGIDSSKLAILDPKALGISPDDSLTIIQYIKSHTFSGICDRFRVYVDTHDIEGILELAEWCKNQLDSGL